MALKEEGNVLLLDEPTNDIDVTPCALEEGLNNFAGCAVIISHDRWFWTVFAHISLIRGGQPCGLLRSSYSEYEEYKVKQLGYQSPRDPLPQTTMIQVFEYK